MRPLELPARDTRAGENMPWRGLFLQILSRSWRSPGGRPLALERGTAAARPRMTELARWNSTPTRMTEAPVRIARLASTRRCQLAGQTARSSFRNKCRRRGIQLALPGPSFAAGTNAGISPLFFTGWRRYRGEARFGQRARGPMAGAVDRQRQGCDDRWVHWPPKPSARSRGRPGRATERR